MKLIWFVGSNIAIRISAPWSGPERIVGPSRRGAGCARMDAGSLDSQTSRHDSLQHRLGSTVSSLYLAELPAPPLQRRNGTGKRHLDALALDSSPAPRRFELPPARSVLAGALERQKAFDGALPDFLPDTASSRRRLAVAPSRRSDGPPASRSPGRPTARW